MRILHTSDWHLGQHFMGKSREQEHHAFIDWLLNTVDQQKVDALLIVGDVFDTGTPPSYARTLYNQFIVRLQKTHCKQLVIVGGNHDSVATLNESKDLLACLNAHVIGGVSIKAEDQIIELKDSKGVSGAIICAIPFIRPREVLESRAGESGADKQQALQEAIARHYQTVFEAAESKANNSLPIIATGHLTTVGGQLTESVREIYIGTLTAFPASAFPKADYIALGHLHRGQTVANQEHIRYSGSPIPLSFDEASSPKQVLLVDFVNASLKTVTSIEIPVFRPLHCIKGSLSTIENVLEEKLSDLPIDKQSADNSLKSWLEIEIITDDYLSDLQARVEQLIEKYHVELLRVRKKREKNSNLTASDNRETLSELKVNDVFMQRIQDEELSNDKASLLENAFNEILSDIEEDTSASERMPVEVR
ncbi:exonuclease subunit SbcD [Endozoicomonas sp. (ex Bugula neritina AB1)]|nr:exonuclease subunit SbcD [Endozoicomonas sp. (ex Bugula neritina AB1)]